MHVRAATETETVDILNVLDGAALETDLVAVEAAIERGEALVAVDAPDPADESNGGERLLGALVLDGDHVSAIAVRRRRRGQGIGTALIERALDRRGRLTAAFDADLRPFYEKLGFEIEADETADRLRGRLERD
ncbi:MAG: GNAT family N-acetyltransferase [Haloarculaceae archaeon]